MSTQQQDKPFVERLTEAVDEQKRAGSYSHGRHKHHASPLFSEVANPSRIRSDEDLFADRVRAALD